MAAANDQETAIDTAALLADAVIEILDHQDSSRFIDWMRVHLASYLDPAVFGGLPARTMEVLAVNLGRMVWNATPLPRNGFRPDPLPEPGRNAPCPCGSGRKYKQCCSQVPTTATPHIQVNEMWPFVLAELPPDVAADCVRKRRVSIAAVYEAAEILLYDDEPEPELAAALLEVLFEPPLRGTDPRWEAAFDLLCDTYDQLERTADKQALLARLVAEAPRSPLRSAAWQHLATLRADAGDRDGAWEAFHHAQRDDPDNAGVGLTEVDLLLAEERLEQARERARFWKHKLERMDETDTRIYLFLSTVVEDPATAIARMRELDLPPELNDLRDWLARQAARPLPAYQAQVQDIATGGGGATRSHRLLPPAGLTELETLWHETVPLHKPFSTQALPYGNYDPWLEDDATEWLDFLDDHPAAYDSLDILDDLATMVYLALNRADLASASMLLAVILERAVAIVEQALGDTPQPRLNWLVESNRPALRALARLAMFYSTLGQEVSFLRMAQRLLELNPDDNHSMRASVAEHLLHKGRDEEVLALADRYPGDHLPEVPLARVLAAYRLGHPDQARQTLCDALRRHRKAVDYLTAEQVEKPPMSPLGVTVGGDDQAWVHRQEVRDLWLAAPGALEWLKETVRGCRP